MISSVSENYLDFTALKDLKTLSKNDSKSALKQVAAQFESIFMKMMLKSMRDASFGDALFDSDTAKFYRDMHDDQLALNLSKEGGVGLANMLVKQLEGYIHDDAPKTKSQDNKNKSGINISRINDPAYRKSPRADSLRCTADTNRYHSLRH